MNEFTNPVGDGSLFQAADFPAILSGNKPLSFSNLANIGAKGKAESLIHSKHQESKQSLLSKIIFPGNESLGKRKIAADIMNSHLIMVQIMMASIMHTYIHAAISGLQDKGMLRHNIKRRCAVLDESSQILLEKCLLHDKAQLKVYTSTIYPSLTDDFIQKGGTLSQKLQCLFYKRYEDILKKIYSSTKKAVDKCSIPNSEIITNIEMVIMICNSGIDFRNYIEKQIKGLMFQIGKTDQKRDNHNEKIACAARDLVRELCGKSVVPDEELTEVREFTQQFNQEMIKGDLMEMVESAIMSMQMDFVEYVIAMLRIKLARNEMSLADYRTLFYRMGTRNNVENLLNEIREIPYEDCEDTDIFDFMESLPESKADTVLAEFRRMCVEDHICIIPERNKDRYLRHFRQKVYRGKGCLDMMTLRYLYNVFGTKKAMSDYLLQAGQEVMGTTLRKLKKIKASDLALNSRKRYALNIGEGIRTMYLNHGYTREQFAIRAGVTKEYLLETERTGDLSRVPYIMRNLFPLITSISDILDEEPRFILFNSLQETEKGGLPPEAYTSLFREMEKVYNDNNDKSEENGKEEKKE